MGSGYTKHFVELQGGIPSMAGLHRGRCGSRLNRFLDLFKRFQWKLMRSKLRVQKPFAYERGF